MINFFNYNNGILTLNIPEIKLHDEFKELISPIYNKGFEGDMDGRQKLLAFKMFTYIYLWADWKSPYLSLDEETKHNKIIKDIKMPTLTKIDPKVKAALRKYEDLLLDSCPSISALKSLNRGLRIVDATLKIRVRKLEEITTKLDNLTVDINNADSLETYSTVADLLDKELSKLLPMGEKIKKAYKDIEDIEALVKKESNEDNYSRGDKLIGNRANPVD